MEQNRNQIVSPVLYAHFPVLNHVSIKKLLEKTWIAYP